MELYTAAQMREIDRVAIQERGIGSAVLMERAAQAVVEQVLAMPWPPKGARAPVGSVQAPPSQEQAQPRRERRKSVLVLCGPGNNGGDGVAAARFLLEKGWRVRCVLVGQREKMSADCKEMERRLSRAGGVLEDFDPEHWEQYTGSDAAVDALFGIGLNSPLRPDAVKAVRVLKRVPWVVSVDIPSGVHADTGEILGHAVRADVTVTFSAGKPGLFVGAGAVQSGRVVVADIGIPTDLLGEGCGVTVMERPALPRRRRDAHKGDFGRLFILAGSEGYTGAPILASQAAVRAGAGLVTLAVPREIYPIAAVKCDEAMCWPWPEDDGAVLEKAASCDVALIGPGLGQGERAQRLVLALLRELKIPVVLDADGLNILSRHMNEWDGRDALTVLTPHDGEFARLSGAALPLTDRSSQARTFARTRRCLLVLKGYHTLVAHWGGACVVVPTGNPGMARGGAGDALAGLIAGLLVQRPEDLDRVPQAVWLHGRAGDLAAADRGEYGMTIGDLIGRIADALKECEEE